MRPNKHPSRPNFGSGPCAKRPGWTPDALANAAVGRSHRSTVGKAKLGEVIDRSRQILGLPDDYRIGIVPASDTGAYEMAMWSMLGERDVDALAWESFGKGWVTDVVKQLKLDDVRVMEAGYGHLPDLSEVDCDRDVLFTWNGTTSGVRVPNGDWIDDNRAGLTFCDATSAAFAMEIPWHKIDVATYSWQKVMGGEAQHGMLVLSPRAVERLERYAPPWPLPKIFRMTKGGKLNEGIFKGETINTPSMLAVEDQIDALKWAEHLGGLPALIGRCEENLKIVTYWAAETPWVDFLATDPDTRSCTSICLTIIDPVVKAMDAAGQAAFSKAMVKRLEDEGIAIDIGAYRDAPPGLRLWGGATVEPEDMEALMPWLSWAFEETKQAHLAA